MAILKKDRMVVLWLVLAILLTVSAPVLLGSAQQSDPQPIQISQNAIGELTAEKSAVYYVLTAFGGETVNLHVLSATPDFAPRLIIFNPAQVEIFSLANPDSLTSLSGSVH